MCAQRLVSYNADWEYREIKSTKLPGLIFHVGSSLIRSKLDQLYTRQWKDIIIITSHSCLHLLVGTPRHGFVVDIAQLLIVDLDYPTL